MGYTIGCASKLLTENAAVSPASWHVDHEVDIAHIGSKVFAIEIEIIEKLIKRK
jgi:hypothetical protein